MARPMQVVKVYGVQDRRTTAQAKLPWVVRYTIDGRHRGKSFRTRIEADRYRGLLLQAVQAGGRFDESTGEPESWQTRCAMSASTSGPALARRTMAGVAAPNSRVRDRGTRPVRHARDRARRQAPPMACASTSAPLWRPTPKINAWPRTRSGWRRIA